MALTGDSSSHVPPLSGADNYNSDVRPGLGLSFTDTTFSTAVRQVTNIGVNNSDNQSYSHCMVTCNGTYFIHRSPIGTHEIRAVADGSLVESGAYPGIAFDTQTHPTDDTKLIYYVASGGGRGLFTHVIGGSETLLKNFGADLLTLGSSHNIVDQTGRYYLYATAGGVGVWDSQTDTTYTNQVTNPASGGGWCGITPDGAYLITSDGNWKSYPINHGTTTVSTTGTTFWTIGGDHGEVITASNGTSYGIVRSIEDGTSDIYRIPVTTDNSAANANAQRASATRLIQWAAPSNFDVLFTHGPNGDPDIVFLSPYIESGTHPDDAFNGSPTGNWSKYKNEILALDCLVGEPPTRICYHRSRGTLSGSYFRLPRPTCNWKGTVVVFNSNMNANSGTAHYADMYAVPFSAEDGTGAVSITGASVTTMAGASSAAVEFSLAGTATATASGASIASGSASADGGAVFSAEGTSTTEDTSEPAECYDLYLRSDVDRGNVPLSYDLNLGSCTDKIPVQEIIVSGDFLFSGVGNFTARSRVPTTHPGGRKKRRSDDAELLMMVKQLLPLIYEGRL